MHSWNVLHMARWKCRAQKIAKNLPSGNHCTTLLGYIFATKACIDNRKKNLLNSNISSTFPQNMVNFCPLAAEMRWRLWGSPAHFNGFRILAALLHSTQIVGISQTLRHWTEEGATYIRQGGHHVEHWPTFLVFVIYHLFPQKYLWMICTKFGTDVGVTNIITWHFFGDWFRGVECLFCKG